MKIRIQHETSDQFRDYGVYDLPAVPRIGEDIELEDVGYTIAVVIWTPEDDEQDVAIRIT